MKIVTRKEAKAAGLTLYFTGKPCKKRGHVAERQVGGGCAECCRERTRRWREENPEKVKENSRRWYEENSEKAKENSRRWQRHNPERVNAHSRKHGRKKAAILKAVKELGLLQEITP